MQARVEAKVVSNRTPNKSTLSRRLLFVGPAPTANGDHHPGGQLTAALGLLDHATRAGYQTEVVSTLKNSFPPPGKVASLFLGLSRVGKVFARLARPQCPDRALIFAGSESSFFERAAQALLCKIRGVKSMMLIRDGYFAGWMAAKPFRRWMIAQLLKVPDIVLVQGNSIRENLIQCGASPHNLKTVPNWLPAGFELTQTSRSRQPNEPLRLIFIGWLIPTKGIEELCKSIEILKSRRDIGRCLVVDVVGGGTLEPDLRQRFSSPDYSFVHIHGWKSSSDVLTLLDAAHVFVLPSHGEGFPNALLEASARGLPSICTAVGAIPDTIIDGHNGFLINTLDSAALARSIERYLDEPDLLRKHSLATLDIVDQRHNSERNLRTLFELFD